MEAKTSSLEKVSLETVQAGADAGILEHREELSNFVCKPLYREQWGIIRHVGTRHDDLSKYKWGTYSASNNTVDTWLVKKGKMPTPHYRLYWAELTGLTIWVARTPGAASVVPWHAAKWLSDRGRIVFEPFGRDAVIPLFLAYSRDTPHRPLIQALLEHCQAQEHEQG